MNGKKNSSAKRMKSQMAFESTKSKIGNKYSIFVPNGHSKAKEVRAFFERMEGGKTSLSGRNIRFDNDKRRGIYIDDILVRFSSASFRSRVAQILLQHPSGERVSWDEIYEHELMGNSNTALELSDKEKMSYKRKVTDAIDAIDEKVQRQLNTTDTLFYRDANEIFWRFIRNF